MFSSLQLKFINFDLAQLLSLLYSSKELQFYKSYRSLRTREYMIFILCCVFAQNIFFLPQIFFSQEMINLFGIISSHILLHSNTNFNSNIFPPFLHLVSSRNSNVTFSSNKVDFSTRSFPLINLWTIPFYSMLSTPIPIPTLEIMS